MKSNRPFRETVRHMLDLEDISLREMIRRGDRHADEPRTMGAIQPIMKGRAEPSIGVMEFVAAALRVDPETFAEYRMWQARRLFDPSDDEMGGFDAAIKNLQALEAISAEADLPLPAGRVAGRRGGKGNGQGKASPS